MRCNKEALSNLQEHMDLSPGVVVALRLFIVAHTYAPHEAAPSKVGAIRTSPARREMIV